MSRALPGRPEAPAFGFALSSEENGPHELVHIARQAEEIGLDFLAISDHFHPWIPKQGNSPFVWSVLGAVAAATTRIAVGTSVTCPTFRLHPAIVAQAAATTAALFDGRFFFGLGTGEALNEHVTGERWPSPSERRERLEEAIAIIRTLWEGDSVNFDGAYYTVSDARLYTLPNEPPPILLAASGPVSARRAAVQDGLIATEPDDKLMSAFAEAGGRDKRRIGQVTICWDANEQAAREMALTYWPTTLLGWEARSNISAPPVFKEATQLATAEAVAENILCGPDPAPIIDKVREYVAGGFDHVYIHQVGTRQADFLEFYGRELLPALRKLGSTAALSAAV